ncbi:MAG: glycine cleavage system aminomethyltransferase GcvT [Parachlamydiaceae bacterium]
MRTALFNNHQHLGAKIIEFADWQMPLQYQGILSEHLAVRSSAGLFDVSHMGIFEIKGREATAFLQFLIPTPISNKDHHTATYTLFCSESGGTIDDIIVYSLNPEHLLVVVNAANRDKDLNHLMSHLSSFDASVTPLFNRYGLLAIQGPRSEEALRQIFPTLIPLQPMHLQALQDKQMFIARTGYTGELGYELFVPISLLQATWQSFLSLSFVKPCGLGCRDTLRLEMGYALYGHELADGLCPLGSVAGWTIHLDQHSFLGKEALLTAQQTQNFPLAYGLILKDKAIAREGFPVLKKNKKIGVITSGSFSPTLNKSIALMLSQVKLQGGDQVEVLIREQRQIGEVHSLPFIQRK